MMTQQSPKRKRRNAPRQERAKRINTPPEDIAKAIFADADSRLAKKRKATG